VKRSISSYCTYLKLNKAKQKKEWKEKEKGGFERLALKARTPSFDLSFTGF